MATHLTKFGIAALVGTALSAVVIGLAAPAVAAPGPGDTSTVDSLGYTVGNDKLGTVDAVQRD
ncbi:hypothetical protein BayCH28_21260 [Mycolicibacterium sp. CH28]|uniref:hypothetical protein n=1 Tax=Mycolicibacterium sp. CH28 TaxID=2512237 RepID=UPI0010812FB4|nr:hypothetical protein [Mycolicibacterium sp. CH28]TGD85555.1 hypothetical protein BayCH28_21260 [Mycolicibacterium sp. CH28]